MQQNQRQSSRVERRGRFTITDLSNEGYLRTEDPAALVAATAAVDVSSRVSNAVPSAVFCPRDSDTEMELLTRQTKHSAEKTSKMTRSTSFTNGMASPVPLTDRKPHSVVLQSSTQSRILQRARTIDEADIRSLSQSHSSESQSEMMDSGVDTVCSVDQTSERRVEQKGRFRIIESNSSPCASDTLYEFDISAGLKANMAYEWHSDPQPDTYRDMRHKDVFCPLPCVVMSRQTLKQELFSGSFGKGVKGTFVDTRPLYQYQDSRQRPNTADVPLSPNTNTATDGMTADCHRVTGRSYGSLLNVVEKQRQSAQEETITISNDRIDASTGMDSSQSSDTRTSQGRHRHELSMNSCHTPGFPWEVTADFTEDRSAQFSMNHYQAYSNDSRSSVSQGGGNKFSGTLSRDAIYEDIPHASQIHRNDLTISDLTEEQRELKQLIGVLKDQLQHMMTYPDCLIETRMEEERRAKEENMRQLQVQVDHLTHTAFALRDQLNNAERLTHQRKQEVDHLSEENATLRRNFGVMHAKYAEERRHSAALELQLNDMIRIANEASYHRDESRDFRHKVKRDGDSDLEDTKSGFVYDRCNNATFLS